MPESLETISPYVAIHPGSLQTAAFPGAFYLQQDLVVQLLPQRFADSHKGTYGRVALWAGSQAYPGALCLSAEAALRSGVGYVEVASDPSALDLCLLRFPEVVLLSPHQAQGLDLDPQLKALAAGPGWSLQPGRDQILENLLASPYPLILDADALNLLARRFSGPALCHRLSQRKPATTLLTPHPGEFARLAPDLGGRKEEANRLAAARSLSQASGVIVLLKGSRSLVALPDGICFICPESCSGLARAGSGDVLTGLCLGLAGQGISLAEATLLAVWIHVKTAQLLASATSERSMRVGDLAPNFYQVFRLLDQDLQA